MIDYSFHMCITDLYDGAVDEFAGIVQSESSSSKVFMVYSSAIMVRDGDMFDVLRKSAGNGDVIDWLATNLVAEGGQGRARTSSAGRLAPRSRQCIEPSGSYGWLTPRFRASLQRVRGRGGGRGTIEGLGNCR